jgi:hypothetical protein
MLKPVAQASHEFIRVAGYFSHVAAVLVKARVVSLGFGNLDLRVRIPLGAGQLGAFRDCLLRKIYG